MKKISIAITALVASIGVIAAPAVQAANADATKPAKQQLSARQLNVKKYGVANLPLKQSEIQRHKLNKATVKRIVKAKKWASAPKARSVRNCESGGNYKINTGNGYYGAYQFAYGSWLGNGGGKFARTANKAPKWAQDYVAYTYWTRAGWGPWACA